MTNQINPINPVDIINSSSTFSNELKTEVVPKSVALYALELARLEKLTNTLEENLKELNNTLDAN